MNWAAWEYMVSCNKRKDRWRAAVGKKVDHSRRMIFDSRPASPYFEGFDHSKIVARFHKVFGASANQILAQQQISRSMIQAAQASLNRMLSHQIDALYYGLMVHDEIWLNDFEWSLGKKPRGKIKFTFYERASRWQSHLTDLDRSSSVTLLPEPGTSRSDGNKSKHGWLSKTRRRSTAWWPRPRTKLIQRQNPAANSSVA